MHILFINPQGKFDSQDIYWTEHPDFGGQLVYVKAVARAIAELGHRIYIVARQIIDPKWPEFEATVNSYVGQPNVRIILILFGGSAILAKSVRTA
jgi:sucrose-phosphate synthase